METLTKPMLNTADRLQQALSGVARLLDQAMNDVQSLDSEVQEHALRAAQEMKDYGTFTFANEAVSFRDITALF